MDQPGFLLDGEWHPLANNLSEALAAVDLIDELHLAGEWMELSLADRTLLIRSAQKFGVF